VNHPITKAEWKEIEDYLPQTRCKMDQTGVIWMMNDEGEPFGAMHPRTFLDMCRDPEGSAHRERRSTYSRATTELTAAQKKLMGDNS
jgi:hypothetical protein